MLENFKSIRNVKDLPEEEQDNFVGAEEGGFVKKEAAEKWERAKFEAKIIGIAEGTKIKPEDILQETDALERKDFLRLMGKIVLVHDAKLIEKFFASIPEELKNDEKFILDLIKENKEVVKYLPKETKEKIGLK